MRRPERVAEQVREEITQIVGYELDDPRLSMVTVTDVRMSENLREARVYVIIEGDDSEAAQAMRALNHAAPYVRRQLGMVLNLKYTPEIHFVRDTVEESATRVEALLSEIAKENSQPPSPEETTAGDPREEKNG